MMKRSMKVALRRVTALMLSMALAGVAIDASVISNAIEASEAKTVTLIAGKGTVNEQTVTLTEDGKLPDDMPEPERTGWTFVGWYTDEVKENYWGDNEGETLEALKEKYPEWQEDEYDKRTFTWIIESDGNKVEAGENLSDGVETLYAMYMPNKVTVTWHFNGWLKEDAEKVVLTGEPRYDSPITPYDIEMHYPWAGHTFDGWYTKEGDKWDFKNVNDYQISTKTLTEANLKDGKLDLYAHWSGGTEATELRIYNNSKSAEPGEEVSFTVSYAPSDANIPTITWKTDDKDVTLKSTDGLTATFVVSKEADVKQRNKIVTVTAEANGVTTTATITIRHQWNGGKYVRSTCTEDIYQYQCKCGATMERAYPGGNGHTWDTGSVTKEPTATEKGEKTYNCENCQETKTEEIDCVEEPDANDDADNSEADDPNAEAPDVDEPGNDNDDNNEDDLTVTMTDSNGNEYSAKISEDGYVSVSAMSDGTYTIVVSKENYAPRAYSVTIKNGVAQEKLDVTLKLYGDLNGDGKITAVDVAMVNAYVMQAGTLDDYDLIVADVVGNDGKVTAVDCARLNAHVQKTGSIW